MKDEDTNVVQDEGRAFGEVAERENGDKPVLVEDKLKAKEESTETKAEVKTEEETKGDKTEVKGEKETTDKKPELTEKGTKLDPNPESAVHQQLANEKKVRSQMEKVLADPKLLTQFLENQYGIKVPEVKTEEKKTEETSTLKEFTAEDFESTEDVARTLNTLQKQFEETRNADKAKIAELESTIKGLAGESHDQRVVEGVKDGITILSQLDELNPKSENFIEGLEEKIVDKYKSLDYDENTGKYLGKYSILDIGKEFIEIAKTARKTGSLNAQTIIKDKSQAKINTSTEVKDDSRTDDLAPEDSIALGISKMFKNK